LFDYGSGVLLTGTTSGGTALLALVGWTGAYANLSEAVASGTAHVGIMTFQNALGITGSPVFPDLTGWDSSSQTAAAAAYSGTKLYGGSDLILSPIPEPTTMALAGLGALSLLLFRRKQA
jgi:hypothetical protein